MLLTEPVSTGRPACVPSLQGHGPMALLWLHALTGLTPSLFSIIFLSLFFLLSSPVCKCIGAVSRKLVRPTCSATPYIKSAFLIFFKFVDTIVSHLEHSAYILPPQCAPEVAPRFPHVWRSPRTGVPAPQALLKVLAQPQKRGACLGLEDGPQSGQPQQVPNPFLPSFLHLRKRGKNPALSASRDWHEAKIRIRAQTLL